MALRQPERTGQQREELGQEEPVATLLLERSREVTAVEGLAPTAAELVSPLEVTAVAPEVMEAVLAVQVREATEQPLDSAPFRPTAAAAEEALEDSLELTVVVAATSREEQEVKGDTRSNAFFERRPKRTPRPRRRSNHANPRELRDCLRTCGQLMTRTASKSTTL